MSGKKPTPEKSGDKSGEKSGEKSGDKLATSREIYHRVRWDPRIDRTAYTIGYEDRGQGMQEIAFGEFEPDGDIPWHRVWSFRRGGEVMWDRKLRIDKLSDSEPALGDLSDREASDGAAPAPLPVPLVEPAAGELIPLLPHRFDEATEAWLPAEAADGSAGPPPAALSLVTFNVLCDLHDPRKVRSDQRLPHQLALLRAADADVIALQEVTPEFLRALLAEPWVRRGYFASDSPRGDTVLPTGEVLLSRFPMQRLVRRRFTRRKTALVAELAVAGRAVRAGVVHLSSSRGPRPQETRAAQLWTMLDELGGTGDDALLTGDFNASEHELDELTAAYGFADAWRELHPGEPGFTFDPERNGLAKLTSLSGQRGRYDRALLRSPRATLRPRAAKLLGTQAITGALYPSDHFALWASFSLEEPTDDAADAAADAALDAAELTHRTAVVLIPPQDSWPAIQELRAAHDKSYRRFMPHLTLLYGFVPEEHFPAAVARLAAAARAVAPFAVRLGALATFAHRGSQTVWARPEEQPAGALVRLQAALQARLPRCDEQSTRSPAGFTPHLTLAQQPTPRDEAERAALEEQLAGWRRSWRPLSFRATEIALISRRGDEPFAVRARLELGSGAVLQAPTTAPAADGAVPSAPPAAVAAPLLPAHARALELLRAAAARALGESSASCQLHVLGSARLGTATAESDLDAFVAGPDAVPREAFFTALREALAATGRLTRARAVPAAFVPVLELSLADADGELAVDLAYVGLPAEALAATATAAARSAPWRAALDEGALDFPSQLTLLGAVDAELLLATAARTSGLPRFRALTSALTGWAKRRAVHGNAHGFLGGFSWAVLAAWAVETHPAPAAATTDELLLHLFAQLAAWDYHRPIALAGTAPYQPTRRREALLLLAPAAPTRNTARNVLRSTLTVLRSEFVLARDELAASSGSRTSAAPLGAPFTPPPSSAASALLTVSFQGAEPAACRGWLDSQAVALLRDLEDHYRLRPFASPSALAVHLQAPTPAPFSSRAALAASARLSDHFAAWPERPPGAALCTSLD